MPETYVDNAYNRRLGRVGMPRGCMPVTCNDTLKTYVDNPYNRKLGRVGLPHGAAVVSNNGGSNVSHKTYVDNTQNRRLGRVGMPRGCMPVTCSGTLKTYVDNPYNRRQGRVGLPLGAAVVRKNDEFNGMVPVMEEVDFSDKEIQYESFDTRTEYLAEEGYSSQRACVDNDQSGYLGEVELPFECLPISRDLCKSSYGISVSPESVKTYVDNPYNCLPGQVGLPHGPAIVLKSGSSGSPTQRTNEDGAQNRSLGGVGLPLGCISESRDSSESGYGSLISSESTKTYVDNSYNRKLGRVGLPHGAAVVSKSGSNGSPTQRTNEDGAQNRSLGGVGLPLGYISESRDSSESGYGSSISSKSSKTYVDNSYNRKLGRVGLPHGAAVVSKSGSNGQTTSSSPSSIYSGKVYTDNPMNRRLGRVGKPHGSMPNSRSANTKSSASPEVYVDDAYNRALGRAGEPSVRDLFQRHKDHPDEDFQLVGTDNDEYTADHVTGLINRQDEVEKWQKETGSTRHLQTPAELRNRYEGEVILFEEIDLRQKIGNGGFGDVYFGKWNQSVVAVKKLRVQRVSKKRLKEFTDELMVFCTLEHKNIVKFIGACVVSPNLAIVMEYMDCSLHEAIHVNDEREFSDAERLSLIEQIMHGLKYLHGKQIAHCDLKSQNVLLELADHPIAKLTDFGLSMMRAESESSVSGIERVRNIGTPRYSAPEVLRGELLSRENMFKADMYSASLIVFEIICDKEPFPQLRYVQLCKHVGEGTMTPDIPHEIQISSPLKRRLRACWSRDPEERPTAASFWSTVKCLGSFHEA